MIWLIVLSPIINPPKLNIEFPNLFMDGPSKFRSIGTILSSCLIFLFEGTLCFPKKSNMTYLAFSKAEIIAFEVDPSEKWKTDFFRFSSSRKSWLQFFFLWTSSFGILFHSSTIFFKYHSYHIHFVRITWNSSNCDCSLVLCSQQVRNYLSTATIFRSAWDILSVFHC